MCNMIREDGGKGWLVAGCCFAGGSDGVNSIGGSVNWESVHEIGVGTLANNMHHGMSRVSLLLLRHCDVINAYDIPD